MGHNKTLQAQPGPLMLYKDPLPSPEAPRCRLEGFAGRIGHGNAFIKAAIGFCKG